MRTYAPQSPFDELISPGRRRRRRLEGRATSDEQHRTQHRRLGSGALSHYRRMWKRAEAGGGSGRLKGRLVVAGPGPLANRVGGCAPSPRGCARSEVPVEYMYSPVRPVWWCTRTVYLSCPLLSWPATRACHWSDAHHHPCQVHQPCQFRPVGSVGPTHGRSSRSSLDACRVPTSKDVSSDRLLDNAEI